MFFRREPAEPAPLESCDARKLTELRGRHDELTPREYEPALTSDVAKRSGRVRTIEGRIDVLGGAVLDERGERRFERFRNGPGEPRRVPACIRCMNQQPACRTQHAPNLAKEPQRFPHVFDNHIRRHRIEHAICKRQLVRVAADFMIQTGVSGERRQVAVDAHRAAEERRRCRAHPVGHEVVTAADVQPSVARTNETGHHARVHDVRVLDTGFHPEIDVRFTVNALGSVARHKWSCRIISLTPLTHSALPAAAPCPPHASAVVRDPIRVLELRSVRGTGGGPEKTILLSAAQHDRGAVAITVCYIRDDRDAVFGIDQTARQLGIEYVEVRERHSFDWRIVPALVRLIRDRRIDIVHAHEYKTDLLALVLSHMTGAVPLATVHGWSGDSARQRLYYALDKQLLRWYPLVITVSEPMRQELLTRGASPERVRKIHNGIDAAAFARRPGVRETMRGSLGIRLDAVVIGAIGRLESEKRFDLLLEIAATLDARPFVVIAGEGSFRPALEKQAADLGIGDRVRLLGHRSDPADVHHAFDVYVQTSDREGIPNALLEAMAVETAIVATDVGGTRELITDGVHGRLAPRGDLAELTAAVRGTLNDPEGTAARVRAARVRVENEFSFRSRLAVVENVYRELLRSRSTPAPAQPSES